MSNPYRFIKLFAFVSGLCMISCTTALAQQSLYVYLQSENLQPFYVQMDDKVYSSSAIGHLVIAGLSDQTCNFEIGFPQQASQTQRFSVPLKNKDHGFQLVQRSKGWALLDLQTDETIRPVKEAGNSNLLYGERKKDDAFATLMAAVVNDSSVLYTSIVKKEVDKVPNVAGDNDKPADNQPVAKAEEKPVQPKDAVNPYSVQAIVDSAVKKGSTPGPATSIDTQHPATTDSVVTKYDPKERGLNDKPVMAGVAKIQQQSKNGETKMVFVDSSETPAKVVTVYINEEKEAENKPAVQTQPAVAPPTDNSTTTNVVKNEAEQEPETKDPGKATAVQTKEQVAEQIRKETWRPAPEEKKPATTDTVTIILESPQMKKTTVAEESKPLYRPKPETQPEPAKPVTKDTAAATAKLFDYGKMQVELVQGNAVVKEEAVKSAAADSSVKTAVTPVKKEKEEPAKETPKAVMEPAVTKKDTAVAVTKPAETEKPKTVEPEKKAETSGKLVMINSDCQKLATDNDVDKMRVKMMAEGDEQKRLAVAQKFFKTMCLYARQIKALSELFTGDESKYKFLELAYPFAADTANFKQLYELLSDEAYVTRFKKLVRLQ
jgi:hypothetical protein